jgi:tetratricopeptide (TPR) repeat protein
MYVCSYNPTTKVLSYTTDSLWSTATTENEKYGQSIIAAIDNSGEEYIFVCQLNLLDSYWQYSLYCYDYQFNEKWSINNFYMTPYNVIGTAPKIITPLSYFDTQNDKYTILIASPNGHLYFVSENSNGQPFISDSITLPACNTINSSIVAGDISGKGMQLALCYIDTINNQCLALIDAGSLQTDTAHLNYLGGAGPWICDFDNDGAMDLVLAVPNQGYYVFDGQLNGTFHADSLLRSFAGFCDINNDGTFEIIYEQSRDKHHFIVGKDISDSLIFELPLPGVNNTYWFGDKEKNGKVDMLTNENGSLYNYEFSGESKTWSWKGLRGNIKNNGNFLQPAYCKANDTVYWSDNISMPAAFEIPYRTTVIIKPGTHIFAADDAQLLVYGNLIAEGTAYHPIQFSANIMTDTKDYWQGITLGNGSASSLKYVEISNAEFGILYEDFTSQSLINSTFENNLIGVGAFNASPKIYQCTFTGNTKAIASYSNGSPILTGLINEMPYKNAIVNNTTGIYLAGGSVYLNQGYNDIYNDPASGYYVYSTGTLRIAAANNYWGSTNGVDIQAHLYPKNYILIDPVCTSANTGFKSADPVKDLLEEAYLNLEEGAINEAEAGFMQIINDYPLHNEAYLSVPGLFACYHATGNNWINLETCLTGLYNDSTSTLDKNLLFGYLNLCLRQQGKYAEAIANYESIILSNPGYNDSVFAVINIGNTYREAGNFKSTLGTLDFLRPASDAAHVEKTIDLLQTLHEEEPRQQPDATAENYISEVFPNPVSGQLTVKYVSSSASVAVSKSAM